MRSAVHLLVTVYCTLKKLFQVKDTCHWIWRDIVGGAFKFMIHHHEGEVHTNDRKSWTLLLLDALAASIMVWCLHKILLRLVQ